MLIYRGRCALFLVMALGASCLATFAASAAPLAADGDRLLEELTAAVPKQAAGYSQAGTARLTAAANALDAWSASRVWQSEAKTPEQVLTEIGGLLQAKAKVDQLLEQALSQRAEFVRLPDGPPQREAVRQYLLSTTELIDLAGRLRYLLRDGIDGAAYVVAGDNRLRHQLLDLLIAERSSMGAEVMSVLLFDPPRESGLRGADLATKQKVLQLIAASRHRVLLPELANLALAEETPPPLVIAAAEVIRQVGLPQEPHPDRDKTLPPPPITAGQLLPRLSQTDERKLTPAQQAARKELIAWLTEVDRQGVKEDQLRVGNMVLRPGDWLLMRNPSPYNRFTDLSPGLFTHVGVVAAVTPADGRRRIVLVDLPERGKKIPVTNAETYVDRTLHYFFVRHEDEQTARQLGKAAADMIGNPTEFDLLFRTKRVEELAGKPLRGERIHTYCAGFLLICAQQTGRPRSEFFPLIELPAGAQTLVNFKKLGLSLGEDFVSPTGPLFSPHMQIIGRCPPLYDPGRQIKEAVYDYFAHGMNRRTLTPSPDAYQAIREKLALVARANPLLSQALASANNVSQHMDLVSAARAGAVIETLDEIADAARDDYFAASAAITAGPSEALASYGYQPPEIENILNLRRRHAALYQQWTQEKISPRELRLALVAHYIARGQQQLDDRFFGDSPTK